MSIVFFHQWESRRPPSNCAPSPARAATEPVALGPVNRARALREATLLRDRRERFADVRTGHGFGSSGALAAIDRKFEGIGG